MDLDIFLLENWISSAAFMLLFSAYINDTIINQHWKKKLFKNDAISNNCFSLFSFKCCYNLK